MTQATVPDNFGLPNYDAVVRARERKRFSTAMFVSGLFHALLLLLLIGLWRPAKEQVVPLPPIPVTLAQLEGQSGAAGNGSGDTAASSPSSEARAASSALETAATPASRPTPPAQAAQPPALPTTPTPVATPVPPRKPSPPQKAAQAQTKPIETPPNPQPPTPAPTQAAPAPSNAASASASTEAILREGVGGRGRGDQGTGLAAVGNGSAQGTADDYLIRVQRWIARFRKYPDNALKQKEEGKGVVGFTIARDGTVLDVWIDTSTGFPDLDAATLAMVRAASPVPAIPAIYPGEKRTLDLPVNFEIGIFDRLFK